MLHRAETGLKDMTSTHCHDECKHLMHLADRMSASAGNSELLLQAWHDRANALLISPQLESLEGEQELEMLSLDLRTEWLRYANAVSSRYMKSPPHFQTVRLPSGAKGSFPYDRWNTPVHLEQRAVTYHEPPSVWTAGHLLFNSGMGAISCLLQVIRKLYRPGAGAALQLHGVGGYFEIMDLMKATDDDLFRFEIFPEQQQLQDSVANANSQLLYVEPVYTRDGSLEVFDMEGFLRAWQQRPGNTPTVIILDTTFVGNTFPVNQFLEQLSPHKPQAVIQISSTLKLDQEGLEFSNAGLMSLFSDKEPVIKGLAARLRKFRAMTGLGLTLEQIAALDYPGFLNRDHCDRHSTAVFINNARLALDIDTGPGLLFIGKHHPSLQEYPSRSWAVAPFVNLQLGSDTEQQDRELLKHVLFKEARLRNLSFRPGSSFGFRAHRVETSIQNEQGTQVIRVAMGCRMGPSIEGTIQLLNDISRMKSFAAVREKHPELVATVRKFAEQKQN